MRDSLKFSLIGLFAFGLLFPGAVFPAFGVGDEGGPIGCPTLYNGGSLLSGKFSGSSSKSLTCDYDNPNYENGDQHQRSHYEFSLSYFEKPNKSNNSEQCSGQTIPYGVYDYFYSSEIYASVGIQVAPEESASSHLSWAKTYLLEPLIELNIATPCISIVDADLDEIPDENDNCPGLFNKDQLDSNNDGIGDACDADGDGITTYEDNCPDVANKDQKDTYGDWYGDACEEKESNLIEQTDSDKIKTPMVKKYEKKFNGCTSNGSGDSSVMGTSTESTIFSDDEFWPVAYAGVNKGTVKFLKGNATIERGELTLPVKLGMALQAGDCIKVSEGSMLSINLAESGLLKISPETTYEIPKAEREDTKTSKLTLFFGKLWVGAKKLLTGKSFEIKTPTAIAGVRG